MFGSFSLSILKTLAFITIVSISFNVIQDLRFVLFYPDLIQCYVADAIGYYEVYVVFA